MSDNGDNFVVLEPQSENDHASLAQSDRNIPSGMPATARPNFLIITADSMSH